MKRIATVLSIACLLSLTVSAGAQVMPTLNEVVLNDISTDDQEFVEICWEPNMDLSAFTIIVIEADANSATGNIDVAIGLTGLVGASGFYTVGDALITCADQTMAGGTLENGAMTMLLVRNFTGSVGMDIDTDDDGVADGPFPGQIVDSVATARPSQGRAKAIPPTTARPPSARTPATGEHRTSTWPAWPVALTAAGTGA
jgi:hypothetical protein